MPKPCHTCVHPDRAAIEAALNARVPHREIARKHGLSASSVFRHKNLHLPAWLLIDHEQRSLDAPADVYAEVRALHSHTLELLRAVQLQGPGAADPRLAFAGIREVRRNLELFARLHGHPALAEDCGSESEDARTLRRFVEAVAQALKPFPEAARAVAATLVAADSAG